MFNILFFPVVELLKWGVYPDPNKLDREEAKRKSLLQDRLDWGLVREIPEGQEYHFQFHITKADANMLAKKVTFPYIEFTL